MCSICLLRFSIFSCVLRVFIIPPYDGYLKFFVHNSDISIMSVLASVDFFFNIHFEIFLVLDMMTNFLLKPEYIGYSLLRLGSYLNPLL